MFTEEINSIAAQLGLQHFLNEIEADLQSHDKHFIPKTTLSPELEGITDPKILFGNNGILFIQLLLFRSKLLIEGSIITLNQFNITSSLVCIRAHYETTGKMAYYFKRLKSYYDGYIDSKTIVKDFTKLFTGSSSFELEEVPEPVQVMCLIDSVDHYLKKYHLPDDPEDNKFRSLYNDLSDYCHPNFHSFGLGSEFDSKERANIFHFTGTMSGSHFQQTLSFLGMSSRLFIHIYDETANLLKKNEIMPIIHNRSCNL